MKQFLASLALLSLALPAQTIAWTTTWEQAAERAKKENKAIFVAVNMDGERANDEMVRDVYRDAALVTLSARTINLFCSKDSHGAGACSRVPGIECAHHKKLEMEIRERYLHIKADEPVAAPQHLFIAADLTLISSAVYRVTKGELEWMWIEAIKKVDPTFNGKPSGRARAPKSVAFGEAPAGLRGEKAPTKEEVDEALKEIKKSRGGFGRGGDFEKVFLIVRSPEKEARDFAEGMLRGVPDQRKADMLERIGKVSPKEWWEVLAPYVTFRKEDVREAAIVSTEQLAEPKALPGLTAALTSETSPALKGHLLRAMVGVAPASKPVAQAITKALEKEKDEVVRMHAAVAAGAIEEGALASTALNLALQDKGAKVRSAAAYAIAARRDASFLPALDLVIRGEQDEATKALLEAAKAAITSRAPLTPFKEFAEKELGAKPDRMR